MEDCDDDNSRVISYTLTVGDREFWVFLFYYYFGNVLAEGVIVAEIVLIASAVCCGGPTPEKFIAFFFSPRGKR